MNLNTVTGARQVADGPLTMRPAMEQALAIGIESDGLLDIAQAHRWFETLRWGRSADLYTFQQPLKGRSGPQVERGGSRTLMLSSYDYLGLLGHPLVEAAALRALRRHGTGSGGVRLLTGTTTLHWELESAIAAAMGCEAAMTLSSGYSANLAVLPALFGPRDRVIADARAHRSIFDACRIAGVQVQRFPHGDLAALESMLQQGEGECRTLVAVDGVYSMDGDVCDLPGLLALKERHRFFLMVDEAHSFGVMGPTGRGVAQHYGVDSSGIDIRTGSLSKAIPANGGFIAGSSQLITYLQHAAAPFIFSAALCPSSTGAALESLAELARSPWRPARARALGQLLREGLNQLGFDTAASQSPIVPVLLGREENAYFASRQLLRLGIVTTAIAPPAVAPGQARLRLCTTAAHTEDDIATALKAFEKLSRKPQGRACRM